jgi:hypothetical protein
MQYDQEAIEYFDGMRVALLAPIGHMEPLWVRSVFNAVAYSWQHGVRIYEMGQINRQVVHWARNELMKTALEAISPTGEPYTHYWWTDTDHVFPASTLCRLAATMAQLGDASAVSALYYARAGKTLPVAYVKDFSDDQYRHFPIVEFPDGVGLVDAVGFGCILCRRELFESIPYPWFRFPEGAGEDMFFCSNARNSGHRVYVDGRVKIGHIGDPQIINEQTYLDYVHDHCEEIGEKIRVGLGGVLHGSTTPE